MNNMIPKNYKAAYKAAYDAAYSMHRPGNDIKFHDYYTVAYYAAYDAYDYNKKYISDAHCIARCIATSFNHSINAVNKLKETIPDKLK